MRLKKSTAPRMASAQAGKYNDTIKAYDEALRLDPKYVIAWNNKGLALYDLGIYDEAILAYDKDIELTHNLQMLVQ